MENQLTPCFCNETRNNDLLISCSKCKKNKLHRSCFLGTNNPNVTIDDELQVNCIACYVEKLDPFEEISKVYISPFLLIPKSIRSPHPVRFPLPTNNSVSTETICIYVIKMGHPFTTASSLSFPEGHFSMVLNQKHSLPYTNLKPVAIKEKLLRRNGENSIDISYETVNKKEKYYMAIYGKVTRRNNDNIKIERKYSYEQCHTMLKKIFGDEIIEAKVTLRCVLSMKIMNTPVRGFMCNHVQCFEFKNFVEINREKKAFKCPICKSSLYISDLFEDLFFKQLVEDCRKKGIDEDTYDIYIGLQGPRFSKKISQQNQLRPQDKEDQEMADYIERMNEDSDENVVFLDQDQSNLNRAYSRVMEICSEVLAQNPSDVVNSLITKLSASAAINSLKDLTPKKFADMLRSINLIPIKKKNLIFPTNVIDNQTFDCLSLCQRIFNQYSFSNLASIWSDNFNFSNLVELIICLLNPLSTSNIDHYFAMELLLALSFSQYKNKPKQKNLKSTIESTLGKTFGYYCNRTKMSIEHTAHVLDLLSSLFPGLTFPNDNFETEEEIKIYFPRMINFYAHFYSTFTPRDVGLLFKYLCEPIKIQIEELSFEEKFFCEVIFENFILPLIFELKFSQKDRRDFIKSWDTHGNFRWFLEMKGLLPLYGFEVHKREKEAILVGTKEKSVVERFSELVKEENEEKCLRSKDIKYVI